MSDVYSYTYDPDEPYVRPPTRILVTPSREGEAQPAGDPMGSLADQNIPPQNIVPQLTTPRQNNLPTVEHPDLIERMLPTRDPRIPISDLQAQQRMIAFGGTQLPGEKRGFGAIDFTPMGTLAQVGGAIEQQDPFSFAGAFNPMGAAAGGVAGAVTKFAPAMFIGAGAKTFNKEALTLAKRLERQGATPNQIYEATTDLSKGQLGFEKGLDKKWRTEISDADAAINHDVFNKAPLIGSFGSGSPGFVLSSILDHPELYKAYPWMRDIEVKRIPKEIPNIRGAFDADNNSIALNERLSPEEIRDVILHELQHSAQNYEKFAQGGSTRLPAVINRGKTLEMEVFQNNKQRLDQLLAERNSYISEQSSGTATGRGEEKLAEKWAKQNPDQAQALKETTRNLNNIPQAARFEAYRRMFGEAEARNTAKRAEMTTEGRFLARPETTEDIPRTVQWPYRERAKPSLQMEETVPGSILRPYNDLRGPVNAGVNAPPNPRIQTVRDPYRMMYPGIYGDPRAIASAAAERVIPEDPAMKRLWGVTRGDLDEMARGRVGNEPVRGIIPSQRGRGSLAAQNVMTPENEQRLVDTLIEGGRYPGLRHADAWYIFDPVFQRMEKMFGPEEAVKRFRHLNTMTGMASPGSDVLTEIQRGTAAHWLEQQGRFADFQKYGGVAESRRNKRFPEDMRYIGAHPYHSTSQSTPMSQYLERGELLSESPKVPAYVHASGVPQTGFQTTTPVGDAHYSRGVGLADTRKGPTDVGASFSRAEQETLSPWWREKVAAPVGIEAVPAQARLWTILGPQTGVESPLGQGKLELFSQQIMKAAHRLGISPEKARDLILAGGAGAGVIAAGAPALGELANQSNYRQ